MSHRIFCTGTCKTNLARITTITQPDKCLGTAAQANKFSLYSITLVIAILSAMTMPDKCIVQSYKTDKILVSLCLAQFLPKNSIMAQIMTLLSQAINFCMGVQLFQ